MAKRPIYQFYAELDDFKPKIWRRFQVKGDVTIARLGYITQVLFEMKASHLMAIEVPIDEIVRERHPTLPSKENLHDDKIFRFEIPMDDEPFEDRHRNVTVMDATQTKLARLTGEPKFWLNLNYDFGDDWWVTLNLEDVFEDDSIATSDLPRVLEGTGYGIVEDVGGVWGLDKFAKAFKNTSTKRN